MVPHVWARTRAFRERATSRWCRSLCLEAAVPLPSWTARDEQASLPAGCAAPGRRPNRPGVDRAARDHPSDHRVRVPHLAGPELIASPDGSRDLRDDVEHATSTILVDGQSLRTFDGFGDVRNTPVAPEPDLVAEDPKSACPLLPTAPSATTPRSLPLQSWTGACSMTYVDP